MGIFGGKGRDEHHEFNCPERPAMEYPWTRRDYRGQVNPTGWGSDEPRTVKRAGADARSQNNRPADHGSKVQRDLMGGTGAIINWGRGRALRIGVTGDGPGRRR